MTETTSIKKFLASPSKYNTLTVSYVKITNKDLKKLCAVLIVNTTLTKINLFNNQIGDAGASAIGEVLKDNTTLTMLNLYGNQIGDAGASAIGEVLKNNTTLTKLYLQGNEIGDTGALAIGEGLKDNATLTKLYLDNNQIRDTGANAIANALKVNNSVINLSLNKCQINDDILKVINNAVRTNTIIASGSTSEFLDEDSTNVLAVADMLEKKYFTKVQLVGYYQYSLVQAGLNLLKLIELSEGIALEQEFLAFCELSLGPKIKKSAMSAFILDKEYIKESEQLMDIDYIDNIQAEIENTTLEKDSLTSTEISKVITEQILHNIELNGEDSFAKMEPENNNLLDHRCCDII